MKPVPQKRYVVLAMSQIVQSQAPWQLEAELTSLAENRDFKVIADLTGVKQLSSAALAVLARFAERCRQNNGELRLVVTEAGVMQMLRVTMLDKVIEVFNTLAEAEEDF